MSDHLRVVSRPLAEDPQDLLEGASLTAPAPWCWVREREGLVAHGEAVRLDVGTGPDRFARAAEALARLARRADVDDAVGLPGSGVVALGSFTFDPEVDASVLVVPRVVLGRRDGRAFETRIDPPGADPFVPTRAGPPAPPGTHRPRFAGSSRPDHEWIAAVAEAIARVRDGRLDKVVLARDHLLWSEGPLDVGAVLGRLARRFPSCHTFHVDGLVGATPELLLARMGARVTSRVLAGTARRGEDPTSDTTIGDELLASEKDAVEHELAVHSVLDVLGPRCSALDATGPTLLRLDNVQHLATDVTGVLEGPGPSALELVGALHPTAAVGGSPREAALAAIAELEGMDRGRYTGPVGWTDTNGDGEWGIALRCAEVSGARARLFAGAGLVAASVPEDELAETRLKLAAMRGVLGDGPT